MDERQPVLEYHVRRRTPWVKLSLLALSCGMLLGGTYFAYSRYVRPRMEQAARARMVQRSFDEMLNQTRPTTAPIAAVVTEPLFKQDPQALARHAAIPCSTKGTDSLGSDEQGDRLTIWQLDGCSLWYALCASYPFQHGTNVYIGRRQPTNGMEFLVALDVTINGITFDFHATALDLATQNIEHKAFDVTFGKRQIKRAEYSFIEDAAYILPGQDDANDPSAFTFVVIHGTRRDTVTGQVQPDGSVTLKVAADPSSENRWRIVP